MTKPRILLAGLFRETHTFVAAGPMFTRRIAVTRGETVMRDGFAFADLVAA